MHPDGIVTRRALPHWYVPGAAHFVTWRLCGTLPAGAAERLRDRARLHLTRPLAAGESVGTRSRRAHKQVFAEYDRLLDAAGGTAWLSDPRVAAVVRGNLYHHHGRLFHLLAYCVMPNHVHALFIPPAPAGRGDNPCVGEQPDRIGPLSRIMHSLKSYTAHQANGLLQQSGPFWQAESYDHWVRDEDELERVARYIADNPVKAGLVARPQDWWFSSAHDRFLADGNASDGVLLDRRTGGSPVRAEQAGRLSDPAGALRESTAHRPVQAEQASRLFYGEDP